MEHEWKKKYLPVDDSDDLAQLQAMSKEELVKKCMDLTSLLRKSEKDQKIYHELLVATVKENDGFKSKILHIEQKEYNPNWSWVNKIVFVLKKIGRPLLSAEIIAFIHPHEPVLQSSYTPAQAFSPHIHKAVKYGRVLAYKLGGSRGYYYILPEWTDAAGRILREYEDKIFFK